MEVKLMTVTPAMAENWLISNIGNRDISDRKVAEYLDLMRKGLWEVVPDAIAFDKSARLMNGQHRLTALVRYGKPLQFMVGTGLSEAAFAVTDTGKIRNAGDTLSVKGFAAPHHKSAIARFVMAYKKGKSLNIKAGRRDTNLSNPEILAYAETHRTKLEEAYEISARTCNKFRGGLKGREVGGLYWILSEINLTDAVEFFSLYATGEGLHAKHPIYTLRNKFIQEMTSRKKSPMVDKLAWTILAWNKFRKDSEASILRWNVDNDDFPKPI